MRRSRAWVERIAQGRRSEQAPARGERHVFTIPAGIGFLDALAGGLLAETAGDPLILAGYRILLPTRRSCRALQEAFLRRSDGQPLLLPRLQPLGDIDADELLLTGGDEGAGRGRRFRSAAGDRPACAGNCC